VNEILFRSTRQELKLVQILTSSTDEGPLELATNGSYQGRFSSNPQSRKLRAARSRDVRRR